MIKAIRLATGLTFVVALAGCGGSEEDAATTTAAASAMPDVVGRQLDAALSDISDSGFEDEVDIVGGGTFGVIDESNWQVCEQSPTAGAEITDAVKLIVDRSCSDDTTESTTPSTDAESEESEPPAATSPESTAPESTELTSSMSTEPEPEEILTAETNADLAALLVEPDYCSDSMEEFASTYRNRKIEFDGHITAMNNHGDYDTRYDILVSPGDFDESSPAGPAFQFRDVNISDLNLVGDNIPDSIGPTDKLHVIAEVVEYESSTCRFLLDPISTELR